VPRPPFSPPPPAPRLQAAPSWPRLRAPRLKGPAIPPFHAANAGSSAWPALLFLLPALLVLGQLASLAWPPRAPAGAQAPRPARKRPPPEEMPAPGTLGERVYRKASLFGRVTLSVPGTVLAAGAGAGAPAAREWAGELVRWMSAATDLYLLARVGSDEEEAAVVDALRAAGCVGEGPGRVPRHRVLTCETEVGKVSVVRQLEPEVHVDASRETVEGLSRFLPRLVLVRGGADGGGGRGDGGGEGRGDGGGEGRGSGVGAAVASNVVTVESLRDYFD